MIRLNTVVLSYTGDEQRKISWFLFLFSLMFIKGFSVNSAVIIGGVIGAILIVTLCLILVLVLKRRRGDKDINCLHLDLIAIHLKDLDIFYPFSFSPHFRTIQEEK